MNKSRFSAKDGQGGAKRSHHQHQAHRSQDSQDFAKESQSFSRDSFSKGSQSFSKDSQSASRPAKSHKTSDKHSGRDRREEGDKRVKRHHESYSRGNQESHSSRFQEPSSSRSETVRGQDGDARHGRKDSHEHINSPERKNSYERKNRASYSGHSDKRRDDKRRDDKDRHSERSDGKSSRDSVSQDSLSHGSLSRESHRYDSRRYDSHGERSVKDERVNSEKPRHKKEFRTEHSSNEHKGHAGRHEKAARYEKAGRHDNTGRNKSAPWGAQRQDDAQEFSDKSAKGFDEKEQRLNETRLYGINACRETFKHRPDDVVKLYLDDATAPKFADVMKHLAKSRKAYHVVGEDELERIAGSQHHGGVVMVVRKMPVADIFAYLGRQKKQHDCLLALDGVGNPHNLGAIMRSCAHFGVSGIVMTEAGLLQSGAAARTAEGGMEHVQGISTLALTDALQACRQAGYTIITTSSHGGESLYQSKLPAKVVVVFGEEMDGVSKAVASRADIGVQIPGSGLVESLNVSVAASLILGEWYRQQL